MLNNTHRQSQTVHLVTYCCFAVELFDGEIILEKYIKCEQTHYIEINVDIFT